MRTILDVARLFASLSGADDEATGIHEAASTLVQGKRESRDKIRGLCSASRRADGAKHKPWGVKRRDKFGSERKDVDIRTGLEKKVLIAARKYLSSVVASEHASNVANADPQQSSGHQDATHQRSSGSDQDVTPQPGNVNRGAAEHASSPGEATPQQSRSNNVSGSGDSKAEPVAEQQHKSSGKQDAEFAVADGQVGVVQPLEVSHHDAAMSVMQVERIDVNLFRVTVADDTVHVLDREMSRALPQGMAKLACDA